MRITHVKDKLEISNVQQNATTIQVSMVTSIAEGINVIQLRDTLAYNHESTSGHATVLKIDTLAPKQTAYG